MSTESPLGSPIDRSGAVGPNHPGIRKKEGDLEGREIIHVESPESDSSMSSAAGSPIQKLILPPVSPETKARDIEPISAEQAGFSVATVLSPTVQKTEAAAKPPLDIDLFGAITFNNASEVEELLNKKGTLLTESTFLKQAITNRQPYIIALLYVNTAPEAKMQLSTQEWRDCFDQLLTFPVDDIKSYTFPKEALQGVLAEYITEGNFNKARALTQLGANIHHHVDKVSEFLSRQGAKLADSTSLKEVMAIGDPYLTSLLYVNTAPEALRQLSPLQWRVLLDQLLRFSVEALKGYTFPKEVMQRVLVEYINEGNFAKAKALTQLGADINADPAATQHLLRDHTKMLFLLEIGIDKSRITKNEWRSLLEYVITSLACDRLGKKGIEFDQSTLDQLFLEHAQAGNIALVSNLALLGANVDAKDASGNTALHLAAKKQDIELAKVLFKYGANAFALNFARQTVLNVASIATRQAITPIHLMHRDLQPRIDALKKDPYLQSKGLEDREIRKLAYFIEIEMPRMNHVAQVTMGKAPKEVIGHAHSLLYKVDNTGTESKRELYLLLQKQGAIRATGTSKKASEAIQIPLELVGQTAKKAALVISKWNLTPHLVQDANREAIIYERLKDLPGMWALYGTSDFTHETHGVPMRRIAFLMAPATGSYMGVSLSQMQNISASTQIAQGLAGMHSRGYIHGDEKGDNGLVLLNQDGSVVAGVMDLGFTFRPGVDPVGHSVFVKGYYGSIWCTAPELFGNQKFLAEGGDLFKAEVFALGDMLYRKHFSANKAFNEQTPWGSIPMKYFKDFYTATVADADKVAHRELLNQHVVKPYNDLVQLKASRPLTIKEEYELAIYKMLHPDVAIRPTMQQAFVELSCIEMKALMESLGFGHQEAHLAGLTREELSHLSTETLIKGFGLSEPKAKALWSALHDPGATEPWVAAELEQQQLHEKLSSASLSRLEPMLGRFTRSELTAFREESLCRLLSLSPQDAQLLWQALHR